MNLKKRLFSLLIKLNFKITRKILDTKRYRKLVQNVENLDDFSEDIHLVHKDQIYTLIQEYCHKTNAPLNILDAGGGSGGRISDFIKNKDRLNVLEIDKDFKGLNFIYGDICNCPQIESNSFDIVTSFNLLEHVYEPWKAISEIVRVTKKNGLVCLMAPFSWRYHPCPKDLYRFSPDCLKYLVERNCKSDDLLIGNDISLRRKNSKGNNVKISHQIDVPPIDLLGGWLENWQSIYCFKKK